MKTKSLSILIASGLTVGLLSSCAGPYDSYGATSVATTTHHQPGYRIDSLPSGYRSEVISGSDYYYHNGAYYRRESSGYVVVEAPSTSRYYTDYNRHRGSGNHPSARHRQGQRHDSVRTHDSVRVIQTLPPGYRVVNHGGTRYYNSGGSYYQRQGTGYIVVNQPY